jgi:hypothetical protein
LLISNQKNTALADNNIGIYKRSVDDKIARYNEQVVIEKGIRLHIDAIVKDSVSRSN